MKRPADHWVLATPMPSHRRTAARVSWQVRRQREVCLRTPSPAPGRRTRSARSSQVLCCLAASALPQRLDRLFQPPIGGPKYVLHYLGHYTHRVAISNHRLVVSADGQVTFLWSDSADHNHQKVMTVSREGFLRRFPVHLLPKSFVRICHFGFLANRRRAALLPRCFAALHATPPKNQSETSTAPTAHPLWRCPKCGGPMAVV